LPSGTLPFPGQVLLGKPDLLYSGVVRLAAGLLSGGRTIGFAASRKDLFMPTYVQWTPACQPASLRGKQEVKDEKEALELVMKHGYPDAVPGTGRKISPSIDYAVPFFSAANGTNAPVAYFVRQDIHEAAPF
jgi:hypothetical protein